MWGNAHDEYSGGNPNKQNKATTKKRRQQSKPNKRPQRPKRTTTTPNIAIEDITTTTNNKTTNNDNKEKDTEIFKYRGRGSSKEKEKKKPNPWAHAHDEYAVPKRKRTTSRDNPIKRATKSPKRRPVRIRFETDEDNNLYNDGDNHPEEKSNIPLNIQTQHNNTTNRRRKRPKKKKTNYVSAANIHAQQFGRSGYRKQLPPDPNANRRTNQQKMAHGQANFETMIKQAAAMEGLDKSDVKVQRMIRRLGDQMNEVSGFSRFLQNRDNELAKMVAKQDKRKKQLNKMKKNINNYDPTNLNKKKNISRNVDATSDTSPLHNHNANSVKDLTAQFERRTRAAGRRPRNQAHRNALKLPNTKSHRRRVSSQFSVQAISAVLSSGSKHSHSPFVDPDDRDLTFPNTSNNLTVTHTIDNMTMDNRSDISAHDTNTLNLVIANINSGARGRAHSHTSRASFSHHSRLSAVPSIVIKSQNSEHSINTLIIASPGGDDGDDQLSHVTPSVDGTYAGDPMHKLFKLLQKEPVDRTEGELDYLVAFFDQYQIMTQDVDSWSGQLTFRSFIQQTRYRYIPSTKHVFREGDDGDVFYFILRGNVAVLVDDSSMVHTTHGSKRNLLTPKKEIHTVLENHVFGEIAMFNQGKRTATCVAKNDTHLAYWDRATYDEYIRPMKELKAKAQKILRDKSGNMLSEDQLIEKAAMFLDDAMHGRELKMHRNGPWPRRIHKLINHKYFNYCLILVSMLWLSLIFIEPPSWRDSIIDITSKYYYRIMPLIAFEWFVFLVFFGECLLRFYSFGRSWFFKIDLHVVRVMLLVIFFLDLCVACIYQGNSFRFSRVVRPVFPILFIRDLRRQYYIVLACVPYVIELIILWCIIAAIFARIAYHIFYHCEGNLADGHTRVSVFMQSEFEHGLYPYDKKMGEYCSAALDDESMTRCDQFFGEFVWNSFGTFFKAMIALFGLATTENYPEVWWPTWLSNDGKQYWLFFVVYILISVFFLLNLFSAAVYDAYQHIISRLDVIDEKRETQALKVAWICLDTGDTGSIGPQKFENLMYRLKPEYSTFEIDVIFKLLDPDNTHLIDAEEFSVMMINMLFISITRKTRSKDDELKLYLQRLGGSCPYGYEILRAFTSQTWRYIILIVDVIDICALLSYHMYPEECNVIDFVCIIMLLFALIIDFIFKHRSQLGTFFKSNRNRLYFGLTFLQTIGTMIGIINDREWVSALRFFGIFRILIVGVFVLEKVKYLRTSLTRTLTQTVIFMIPVFVRIVFYTVIVLLYIYTIIGTEVFVDPDESTWGKNRCSPPQQLLSNPYALFCDANMSIITLIQILTTNNWHIIMYTAIQVTDNWFNAIYFITFFFLGPILVVSLLLAMFFNMFFGISVQSENELSAFFQETDAEAQSLKQHMELQQFREQMQIADEEFMRDVPLPTEVGISELPNGAKILTIRKIKNQPLETNDEPPPQPGDIDTNTNPNITTDINTNEVKIETELVHIPLHNVARQIWDNIPGEDWNDERTNNTYKQTFTGKQATNYLLEAGFAPDGEEAVDYLALIMDEMCAFMRVDVGKEQEFENNDNAHYQWIIVPEDEEDDNYDLAEEYDENDQVALEDIMIGFRHSYGGYHRLLKQYRAAGIDPAQQAARDIAAKHAMTNTPLSEMNTPVLDNSVSPIEDNSNSPVGDIDGGNVSGTGTDLGKKIVAVAKHVHSKSQKTLDGITMKLKQDKQESKEEKPSPISINISHFSSVHDDGMMAESDDEGIVVNNIGKNKLKEKPRLATIDSTVAEAHGLPQTKPLYSNSNTKNFTQSHKTTSVELSHVNKAKSNTPSTKMRKTQSNEIEFKRTKTLPQSENEDTSHTTAPLGRLQKSKSVKQSIVKPGGLNRSASSKNILLRHLDRPKRAKNQHQ